jgi:xylulokinase
VTGSLFLGVDIGTSSAKGVVIDAAGVIRAQAVRPHAMQARSGGRREHDAEQAWWGGFATLVHDLLASDQVEAGRIAAVGCSGIGPCVLPVDASFRPLGPAILYGVDTRARAEIAELERRLGRDAILARCGNHLSSQSAGPKIAWLARHEPAQHAAAAYFLTCQSFLVARLTGEVVIDHATASYFHPLYNLRARSWDLSGCEEFVSAGQLGRLAWSSEVAGRVTADAARQTGLAAGTPVIAGTADAPAEAVASGVVADGDLMVMYGSSSFMIQMTDRVRPSEALWSAAYVFPGSYCMSAGTATAGSLTGWVADLLGLAGEQRFDELARLAAASPPGARGVLCLPYFSGERTPVHDPRVTGLLAGLTLEHDRADIARAAIEGIAHSMGRAIGCFAEDGLEPARLVAVGGGTRNQVWLQAVSDIAGREQLVTAGPGASQGDAQLAAIGAGLFTDGAASTAWVRRGPRVAPDARTRPAYRDDHRRFLRWTERALAEAGLR